MSGFKLITKKIFLLCGDALVFFLSLAVTLLIRYPQNEFTWQWDNHLPTFAFVYFLWLFVFYIQDLYDLRALGNNLSFVKKIISALTICAIIATAVFYLNPNLGIAPKTNLFLNLAIVFVLLGIWRSSWNSLAKTNREKIVIFGSSEDSMTVANVIKTKPQLGYELLAQLGYGTPILDIKNLIEKDVRLIVLDCDDQPELSKILYESITKGINIVDISSFYETVMLKVPLSQVSEKWFLNNLHEADKRGYEFAKNIVDFILAIIA
ncbi:MAG: hypothetical protein HY979_03225, partial [Candidatus Magasanikbacteria bacterium]|nr:hypothetical protein [Candidatus Magasanikbacteria bacterium]